MKKMYEEEDDLKELLELEMIREAQILEETLLSEGDLDNLNLSDDDIDASFAELQQRLKEEGVYRSDEEMAKHAQEGEDPSEKEIISPLPEPEMEERPNKIKPVPKHFSVGKAAGFVLIVLLSVFAGSMTSEANRQYLVKQFQYLKGDNSAIIADNDEKADFPVTDEIGAIEDIKKTLNVEVPDIYYRPYSFKFLEYYMDEVGGIARIEYDYAVNSTRASLTFYNRTADKSSITFYNHGDKIIKLPNQEIDIYIREITNANSETEYDATWKYQDVLYDFRGRMAWEEFEKIIKSIQF